MRVSNRCRRDLWWALLFVLSCCGLLLHARPVLGEVAPTPDRSRILWTEKRNPPPLPESLPGVDVLWAKNMCRAQEEVFPGTGAKDEGKDYLFPLFKYEWLSARPGGDRESPDTLVAASGNILDVHDPDSCERLELCCYQMTVAECTKDSDCSSGLTCGLCPMGDPGCSAGQQVCLAPGGKVTGTDEQRKAKAECLGIVRQNVNLADGYRRCGPAKYGYYKSRLCNLGGDVPFSHPFGDDWSAQMINAPQYENLLAPNDSGCEACAPEGSPDYYDGCLTCPPGLLRSDTNPNGVMANSDAVEVRRRTGRSSMHIEYEKGMFPKDFYPKEGDDLAVFGRHIVDCGHDNYTAEIHPPLLLASASPSKTGGCASKLIARNFYNSQEFWNGRTTEGFLKNIIVELLQSLLLKRNLLTMEVGSDFAEPFTGDFVGPKALEYFLQPREGRHNPFDQLQVSVRAVERTGVSLRIADARPELDGKDAVKVTVELKGADYANGWRRSVAKDPDLVKTEPRILRGHDVAVISKDYAWLGNLEDWMWGVFGVSALVTVTGLCNNVITCAIATVMIMNVSRVIATGMLTSFYTNRDYDRPGGSWVATPRATRPLCTFSLPQLSQGIRANADDEPYPVLGQIDLEWKRSPQPKGVVAGMRSTCALMDTGTVMCWGANDRGQLGTHDLRGRTRPDTAVLQQDGHILGAEDPVVQLSAGKDASAIGAASVFAVTRSGLLYGWGSNYYGGLGIGLDADLDPHDRAELINAPGTAISGVRFQQVAAGAFHACALSTKGEVYCWGPNSVGQLGPTGITPPTKGASSPIKAQIPGEVIEIAAGDFHTCARLRDGNVICWGWSNKGRLGDGTGAPPANPPATVKLNPAYASRVVAGGSAAGVIGCVAGTSCAQKIAVLWGDNTKGKLGDGSDVDRLAPVQALLPSPADHKPLAFDIGPGHACAIVQGTPAGPAGRSVYCWGANDKGQVNASGADPVKVPEEVSGWSTTPIRYREFHPRQRGLGAIAAGGAHSCVMGEATIEDYVGRGRHAFNAPVVMCWGDNSSGQLGNRSTTSSATPVAVDFNRPGCLCDRVDVCDDVYTPVPEPPDDSEPGCFNPCRTPNPTRPMAPYCDGLEDIAAVPAGDICGALDACCESPKLSDTERALCHATALGGGPDPRGTCSAELRGHIAAGHCDGCVTEVCRQDPACCSLAWDDSCTARAGLIKSCQSKCGYKPARVDPQPPPVPPRPEPPGELQAECTNEHTACEAGGKAMAWTCNECAKAVCQVDVYCCDVPLKGGSSDTGLRQAVDQDDVTFAQGTHAGTKLVKLARGEVTLAPPAPTIKLDFPADRELPADWDTTPLFGGPPPKLDGDGNLVVDGASFSARLAGDAPQQLEIQARLGFESGQTLGFADKGGIRGIPLHYFQVAIASGGGLVVQAVSDDGVTEIVTAAGAPMTLMDEWHTYTIVHDRSHATFFVDGKQVADHAARIETPLRPVITDMSTGGWTVRVKTVTVTPYRGIFTSRAFDAGKDAAWGYVTPDFTQPPGTSVRFELGVGSAPDRISRWIPVQPGRPVDAIGRYARYRAIMESSPSAWTAGNVPVVNRVTAEYGTHLGPRDWNMACRTIAETIPSCGCNPSALLPAIKDGVGSVGQDESSLFSLMSQPRERIRVTASPLAKANLDLCVKRLAPPDASDHMRWTASCDAVAAGSGDAVTLDYSVPDTAGPGDRLYLSVYGADVPPPMRLDYRLNATRDHVSRGDSTTVLKLAAAPVLGGELLLYGPFPAPAGARLDVSLSGTHDADLYVRRAASPTLLASPVAVPDFCAPLLRGTSNESCTLTLPAGGPDFTDVYVSIAGMSGAASDVALEMKTGWSDSVPTGSGKLYKLAVQPQQTVYLIAEGATAADDIDLYAQENRSPLDDSGALRCAGDPLCKSFPHAHPATVNSYRNENLSPVVLWLYVHAVRGGAYRLEARPSP